MLKKVIINLKSFLLTINLIILTLLIVLSSTILNKNYLLNVLEKNNFYESTYHNLNDTLKGYVIQSGLEQDVILTLYDKEKVEQDIKIVIDGIYENKEITIDTKTIKTRLETIIDEQIKKNNRIMTSTDKKAIQDFVNTVLKVYEEEIIFSKDLALEVQKIYPKVTNLMTILIIIFTIIFTCLTVGILILSKNKKVIIKKLSVSFLATGILLILVKLLLNGKFQHILIINAIFSKILIYVINDIINKILLAGIIIIVLGIICSILEIENNQKHK